VHIIEWLKECKTELMHNIVSEDLVDQKDLSVLHTAIERLVLALDMAEREERKHNDKWTTKQQEQKNRHKEVADSHNPFKRD